MPIIKKSVFNKTTILTNEFLQNKNISLEAKGLLGYMLSLPNNWDFTIAGISSQTNTSEYKITKLLQELEANGYHTKKHIYENGRIKDWVYYIFAEPRQDIIDKTFTTTIFEQELDFQDVENQECCFSSDKQTISNKLDIEKEKNKKEYNTEKEKSSKNDLILKENIKCIIDYLNETVNGHYKYNTKETVKLIKARFKDGYVLDDFYDVIDKKWNEWKGTPYQNYVKPDTLFKENHFENYLNQKTYFKGTLKSSYSSKPNFDNTRDNGIKIHHISDEEFNKLTHEEKLLEMEKFDAVADMTPLQKEFHNKYCLARDENGNLCKF